MERDSISCLHLKTIFRKLFPNQVITVPVLDAVEVESCLVCWLALCIINLLVVCTVASLLACITSRAKLCFHLSIKGLFRLCRDNGEVLDHSECFILVYNCLSLCMALFLVSCFVKYEINWILKWY